MEVFKCLNQCHCTGYVITLITWRDSLTDTRTQPFIQFSSSGCIYFHEIISGRPTSLLVISLQKVSNAAWVSTRPGPDLISSPRGRRQITSGCFQVSEAYVSVSLSHAVSRVIQRILSLKAFSCQRENNKSFYPYALCSASALKDVHRDLTNDISSQSFIISFLTISSSQNGDREFGFGLSI